jgi:transposase
MIHVEAERMFREGKSVNAVAAELKTTWWEAHKMKRAFERENGIVVKPKRKPAKKKAAEPEVEVEEVPENWDVSISVPSARLNDIFDAFSAQEKADAIAGVLQSRINAALEAA